MKYCTIKLWNFLLVNWESLQHYVIHWTSSWAVVVLFVHAYHGIFSTTIPPKCSWGWRNSSPWSTSLFCSNHGQKNWYIYIREVKSNQCFVDLWKKICEAHRLNPETSHLDARKSPNERYRTCVFWWWKECNWPAKLQKFTDCRWTSSRHLFWTKLAVVSKASVSVHPPGFGSSCPAVQQNLWNHNMLLYYYAI